MVIPAIVVAVLALHPAPWKHVVVTRSSGPITATLAYDARAEHYGERDLRRVTLRVTRGRSLMVARKLAFGRTGFGRLSLALQDVWGDGSAEVVVALRSCANRCSFQLYVALPQTGSLVFHDFGVEFPKGSAPGWSVERRGGIAEFVTDDSRFFCWFADCASSTMPVQVLRIDASGRRFVDISRTRPDLLRRDARSLWRGYLEERAHAYHSLAGPNWYGTFVPYCADAYRLGPSARCDRMLTPKVKRQLTAWGYR